MTMAEIFVTAYLLLGGIAAILIWTVLMASKRRDRKEEKNVGYGSMEYRPIFRERNTKPSRSNP
jgi:hypothetical protein